METLNRFLKWVFILPVKIYQYTLSPLLGANCRFQPTCSHYMVEAIQEWGPLRGIWLGLKRIFRCRPGGPWGYDPVPKNPRRTA